MATQVDPMHAAQRSRFFDQLRERRAAAVIPTSTPKTRSNDTEYRFRADSDFWYLSGFDEPGAVLVFLPALSEEQADRCVLFLRPLDKELEIWHGRRLGIDAAPKALGVDEARSIDEVWDDMPGLLRGYGRIVWRTGQDEGRDRDFLQVLGDLRRSARGRIAAPIEVLDPAPILHEQRLRKSPAELDLMRRAAEITGEAHALCMQAASPGTGEHEVDALLEYTFRRRGGAGPAYTNIVAGGALSLIHI